MREPALGQLLAGKYEVRGVLGRGGMGLVLSAWHLELGQKVAIKYLLPEALLNQEVVERFAREARAAAQIRGEHVVRVLDVGRFDDGTPFIVMEHLDGHDLAVELAQRGQLTVTEAVRYVLQACEALAQAHAARIVHRDLKPSNLFLAERPGRRPVVKVLDFGISKFVDPDSDALTKTAAVIGTAHYMSPEQLLAAKSVDERSDLWSLGVILHQLLVGKPPFLGESAPEIIAQIIRNAPPRPRTLREDLPAGLEAVILRCLRTEPGDRFAHVGELAAALLPFAAPEDAESVAAIARVVRASAPSVSARATEPGEPQVAARMVSPAATPLEIASTISENAHRSPRASRRGVVVVAAAAAGLAAIGWFLLSPAHRGASITADAATASAPATAAEGAPVAELDAAKAPPVASAPLAIAIADASLEPAPRASARPSHARPSAPVTHAAPASSAPHAPASSPPAGADPLDIPLR